MSRKYLFVIVVLVLALWMSACNQAPAEQEPSYPTLPAFDESRSPAQQLADAIDKAQQHKPYGIRYGMVTAIDGQSNEAAQTQSVTRQRPLDLDAMNDYLPYLPNRDGFLTDFCNRSLHIIPSNTGTVRYQLSDLDYSEVAAMLYAQLPEEPFPGAQCEIALEVDSEGRFSRFELKMELGEAVKTAFLELTFHEEN